MIGLQAKNSYSWPVAASLNIPVSFRQGILYDMPP